MTKFTDSYKLLKKKISFSPDQQALIQKAIKGKDGFLIGQFSKIFDDYSNNENKIAEEFAAKQEKLNSDFDMIKRTVKKNYVDKPMEKIEKKERKSAEGILRELDQA